MRPHFPPEGIDGYSGACVTRMGAQRGQGFHALFYCHGPRVRTEQPQVLSKHLPTTRSGRLHPSLRPCHLSCTDAGESKLFIWTMALGHLSTQGVPLEVTGATGLNCAVFILPSSQNDTLILFQGATSPPGFCLGGCYGLNCVSLPATHKFIC